jgi:hypothetical protein
LGAVVHLQARTESTRSDAELSLLISSQELLKAFF